MDDNHFGWSLKLLADGLTVKVGDPAHEIYTGRVQVFRVLMLVAAPQIYRKTHIFIYFCI